jgi:hypothetical protein
MEWVRALRERSSSPSLPTKLEERAEERRRVFWGTPLSRNQGTFNIQHSTSNLEYRTRNLKLETWNPELSGRGGGVASF